MSQNKKLSEAQIQSSCVIRMHNEFPETRGCFFAVKNEGAKISIKKLMQFLNQVIKFANNPKYIISLCSKFMKEVRSGNPINGAIDRAMGVTPGVSDTLFFWGKQLYCFEFKTEIGRQSLAQKKWQSAIEKQGAIYYVVRSECQFFEIIGGILR